jgi:hypothetical protein
MRIFCVFQNTETNQMILCKGQIAWRFKTQGFPCQSREISKIYFQFRAVSETTKTLQKLQERTEFRLGSEEMFP